MNEEDVAALWLHFDPLDQGLPVRLQDRFGFHLSIIQKTVGRHRFIPTTKSRLDACRRIDHHPLQHIPQAFGQSLIAQFDSTELTQG